MRIPRFEAVEYVNVVCSDCRKVWPYASRRAAKNFQVLHIGDQSGHLTAIVKITKEEYLEALKA